MTARSNLKYLYSAIQMYKLSHSFSFFNSKKQTNSLTLLFHFNNTTKLNKYLVTIIIFPQTHAISNLLSALPKLSLQTKNTEGEVPNFRQTILRNHQEVYFQKNISPVYRYYATK